MLHVNYVFSYSAFQWIELINLILTVLLLTSDLPLTIKHIVVCSVTLGVAPGIRCVLMVRFES